MIIREIVAEWLNSHGYDGLYTDECGCPHTDLFPCDSDPGRCKPGVRLKLHDDCDGWHGCDCIGPKGADDGER